MMTLASGWTIVVVFERDSMIEAAWHARPKQVLKARPTVPFDRRRSIRPYRQQGHAAWL